jgi:aminoglycoside 3-N-acetyltransferase
MFDKQDWIEQLKVLGVKKDMVVVLDGELNQIDYTVHQYNTFLDALLDIISNEGTVVYISHHEDLIEPGYWQKELPLHEYDKLRKQLASTTHQWPAHDLLATTFLLRDDTFSKHHPSFTVMSIGKYARFITRKIPLHFPNGEYSPMQSCLDLKAYVIVLNELSLHSYPFHHAITQKTKQPTIISGGVMIEKGVSRWQKHLDSKVSYSQMMSLLEGVETNRNVNKIHVMGDELILMAFEHLM